MESAMKKFCFTFVLPLLLSVLPSVSVAEVLIAKDQYLFVPKSEARRLLLEPGAILLRLPVAKDQVYKKRTRVVTLGGVEGEVRAKGVDSVHHMSGSLAYVKQEIQIKGTKYPIGTIFPVKVIEDEDETLYRVTYPKASYSVKDDGFVTKEREKELSAAEFSTSFNLINPAEVSQSRFPFWRKSSFSPTEWGCGESKTVEKTVDANAAANVSGEGGFFSFFQAKAEASAGASTSTTYRKVLEDEAFKHRVTYWNLMAGNKSDKLLLQVALEKVSVCDSSKGVNNSYIIRFDKKLNRDDIKINSVWAGDNQFSRGGGSPVRIDNQNHLKMFENALKDFKLIHTIDGYDANRAIFDFSVWFTTNLNYAGRT
ncbi:hypothetical protein [Bacterioplanoides sp.]|uniref:hypothetical protein n=1 Tax=Bacterioplanoides sp. TaxID=2066072 RepID=UPI003B5BFBBB